jgi:hypothetical protein
MSEFVYGVTAAAPAAAAAGVENRPVRAVTHGELAALVSDLDPGKVPGRREDLDAHARVLAEAIEAQTVVPMRFGVVMDDDDAVRETLLVRNRPTLRELLGRLDGHVQLTLKAFYLQDALLLEVVRSNPEVARLRELVAGRDDASTHGARVRLGQLVAQAVEVRRAADERALLERLSPLVADIVVEPPAHERMALHAQLLVARARREEVDAVVHELSERHADRLRFRYIGPLAPFSFAEVPLDAGDPAWA